MILGLPNDYDSVSDTESKRILWYAHFAPRLASLRIMLLLGARAERHGGNEHNRSES